MSLPVLQQMRAKRLQDAAEPRGYAVVPGVLSERGRAVQLHGSAFGLRGEPTGGSAFLSVYQQHGQTYIQRGWVDGREISGTGLVSLGAGDRVYVKALLLRQSVIWFTSEDPEPVTYRYLTGAYRVTEAEIKIVSGSVPTPDPEEYSGEGNEAALFHVLIYTVPADGVIPVDGSVGRRLNVSSNLEIS